MRRSHRVRVVLSSSLFAVLAGASAASAQETILKAGVTSSAMSFDRERSDAPDERRTGWVGGVAFLLGGADRGGWQVEALVVQKGARNLLRVDDEIRFTYLEIPVMLHMDFWQRGGSTAAYFTFGPSLAVNLDASYIDDGVSEDIGDDVERVDVGLNLGVGLELGPIVVDARYTWGLRSAFTADDADFKHRTFAVTAGLRFR